MELEKDKFPETFLSADQTAGMRRPVYAFDVSIQQNQIFSS